MVGAAICFSVSFAFVRHLSDSMATFQIVLFLQISGALIMLPWVVSVGISALAISRFHLHILRGLLVYGGLTASFYSFSLIPLADSTSLQFTLPLFTAFFAMIFLRERVGVHRWAAIIVGFGGVLIILRPGLTEISLGMVLAIVAAASYGASDICSRALTRTDPIKSIIFLGFVLQIPLAAIPALPSWVTPTWGLVPAIVAFVLCAFGAQWCLMKSLSLAEASLVSPVLFLRLPFVALIGYVAFGQVSDMWTWIGAVVIFAGTFLLARGETNRSPTRSPEP